MALDLALKAGGGQAAREKDGVPRLMLLAYTNHLWIIKIWMISRMDHQVMD